MGVEIERKFLVAGPGWQAAAIGAERLAQGYLAREGGVAVRIRRAAAAAWITVKGPGGLLRAEFEYAVPLADADALLALCVGRRLEKTRHRVPFAGRVFEVDAFEGALAGLVLAEVELPDAAAEITLPPWIGAEVTGDPRYNNAALASAAAPP
jgi:adenylate cyclase